VKKINVTIGLGNGANKITKDVYDFEVPVLATLHGAENIAENSEEDVPDMDAQEAYTLLVGRYGSKASEPALLENYRDLGQFIRVTGLKSANDDGEEIAAPAKKTAKKK